MKPPRRLLALTALTLCVLGWTSAGAADATWTKYGDVQYGPLHRGNKEASVNLVSVDIYVPDGLAPDEKLPLVLMVHGGSWRDGDKADEVVIENKVPFFTANGYVFASTNYELSPAVKFPVHAEDVAAAIAFLYRNAATYHIDPDNITIMGHSAGAQIVANVSVDGALMRKEGLSKEVIKRTILLDGIYNLPYRLRTDDKNNKAAITQSFGSNPIILRAASPALNVKKSSREYTPPMLNFFAVNPTKIESDLQFIEVLRKNGIPAGGIVCRKFSHKDIDWYVGLDGSEMNQPILDFLSGVNPNTLDQEIEKTPGPPPPGGN